jgi:translation initiation factor IF-2
MSSTNVSNFAAELKVPAEVLLEQLRAAGVEKRSAADNLTEADKAAAEKAFSDFLKNA